MQDGSRALFPHQADIKRQVCLSIMHNDCANDNDNNIHTWESTAFIPIKFSIGNCIQ